MAQPAIGNDLLDPTLVARAQRYEPEAVASLCDRNLDTLFRMCQALTGDPAAAEALAATALMKALDGLPGFDGDGAAFRVWLLRLAATAAAKRRPQGSGTRQGLARLSNFDYELVSLRVLGEVDVDHLSPALNAQPASLRAWLVSALREVGGRAGTGWGHDLRAFDNAIDDVIDGTEPAEAATTVQVPGDAEAMLRTVADLRGLDGVAPQPDAVTRLRTSVLAAAAERRALWVHRHHVVATVPGIEQRRYPSRTGTVVALGFAALLAVVVGSVVAVLSSFAGPTSNLYALKRLGENALVAANVDTVDRAQLEIKLAETRDREAEDMAGRGEGDLTVQAVDARFRLLRAASRDLIAASVHDQRWRDARKRLFQESDVQMTQVERDLQASGQGRSSQDVQQLIAAYEADSKQLQAQLGRPASQTGQQPGTGTPPPVPQPTAS